MLLIYIVCVPGYRLKDNVVKVFPAATAVDCALLCLRHVCCKSINYREKQPWLQNDSKNCELCNVSSSEKPGSLENQEFTHYDVFKIEEVSIFKYNILSPGLSLTHVRLRCAYSWPDRKKDVHVN
jgi:hypothetical protein